MGVIFGHAQCRHGRNLGSCYLCENIQAGNARAQQANNNAQTAANQRARLAQQQQQVNRENTRALIENERQIAQAHIDENRRQIAEQRRRELYQRLRDEEFEREEAAFRLRFQQQARAQGMSYDIHAADAAWLAAKIAFRDRRRQELRAVRTQFEASTKQTSAYLDGEEKVLEAASAELKIRREHTLDLNAWLKVAVVLAIALAITLPFTKFSWLSLGLIAGALWGVRQLRRHQAALAVVERDAPMGKAEKQVGKGVLPLTAQTKALYVSLGLPVALLFSGLGVLTGGHGGFFLRAFWGLIVILVSGVGMVSRRYDSDVEAEFEELQAKWASHAERAAQLAESRVEPYITRSGLDHWVGA